MVKESLEAVTALADLKTEFNKIGDVFPHVYHGKNMEPAIEDGAIIGVDPSDFEKRHLIEGEVYLFESTPPGSKIKFVPILKRIVFVGDGWLLKDDSAFFEKIQEPQKVTSEEIRRLLIGRVKWIVQKCY